MVDGYYYLHENGSLIYKRYLDSEQVADFRESPFVRHFWGLDTKNRADAWQIVVEACALGADPERVRALAKTWACDDADAANYAKHIGIELYLDGPAWCAALPNKIDLQSCPHGFGDTALEAMADLAKQVGFRAQKTWGATFADLVKCSCKNEKITDAACPLAKAEAS